MFLQDVAGTAMRPGRSLPGIAAGRPAPLAVAVVIASGLVAAALSLLSVLVEPAADQAAGTAAGVGVSAVLPLLFAGVWLADAFVIDAVAQLMGCPRRRREYLVTSAYAVPLLTVFELVRLVQALLDRAGGSVADAATGLGFVEFVLLAWFIVVLAIAVRAVYGLPPLSAVTAALAPYAVMVTLLLMVLIVASVLHIAGVGG